MTRIFRLCLLLLCIPLTGCGVLSLGVKVKNGHTSAKQPSDVTAYISVVDGDEPVSYLDPSNFAIHENDVLLNNDEVGLRLLPRDSIAEGVTILLLDLSGDPNQKEISRIERGAAGFVAKVSTTQPVIVLVFDGSVRPREVTRFPKVPRESRRALPPLLPFLSGDSSRDLRGALSSAIVGLKGELKKSRKAIAVGTIVTMSRGPDLAGRKTLDEISDAVDESGFTFFSLTPTDSQIEDQSEFGKDGEYEFETLDTLPLRFQDVGMRVRNGWYSNYLLSYCSPARAGVRKLKVLVNFEASDGGQQSGSVTSEFDASGFKGGCVPKSSSLPKIASSSQNASTPTEPSPSTEPAPKKKTQKRVARRRQPKPVTRAEVAETEEGEQGNRETDGQVVAPPSSGKYE